MKRLNKKCFFSFLLFIILISCKSEKDTLVIVGTSEIKKEDFEIAAARKAALLNKESLSEDEKKELLETMIKRELLFQYAKKSGIRIKDELIKAEAEKTYLSGMTPREKKFLRKEAEKNLYIKTLRNHVAKDIKIDSEDIKAYYRKHINEFREPDTYRIYLLQVKESDALHLIEVFNKNPEVFDKNALENVPPDLKELNRTAPYTPLDGFPEEMIPFLKKAEKGRIYGPVKTPKGVFLFKLIDKRQGRIKQLPEVYNEIEHILIQGKIEEKLSEIYSMLRKRENIKYL